MANFFDIKGRQAAVAAASSSKPPTTRPETGNLQPWVEKYRPKSLDDINGQEHTVTILSHTRHINNLPHMLFYGPPGTGKTSTILALAKQLYGPELMKTRVLELNASDERGIAIVRDKVKSFARQQLSNPPTGPAGAEYRKRYRCPPFKIVVLDEADSMTQDAQSALRRTMETYSRITRFCLVCNYVTRIIDPLASRCSKFRFKSLDPNCAAERLVHIAGLERVRLEAGAVEALVRVSEGDLRKAITFLQSAARLMGPAEAAAVLRGQRDHGMDVHADAATTGATAAVTVAVVEEIAGVVPGVAMDRLYEALQPQPRGSVYEAVAAVVEDMVADGWSATQVITQMYERVLFDEMVDDLKKNTIILAFSETDKRLVDGADEHLEILDLCLSIARCLTDGRMGFV